jgi:hypothetical protein
LEIVFIIEDNAGARPKLEWHGGHREGRVIKPKVKNLLRMHIVAHCRYIRDVNLG